MFPGVVLPKPELKHAILVSNYPFVTINKTKDTKTTHLFIKNYPFG